MSSLFFLNISQPFSGLCNQLNSIFSTICLCVNNEKIIVIDKFLKEIYTDNYAPISNIIDLEQTNIFLEKYNIALVDGNFTDNLHIINAKYGCDNTFIDVTDKVKTFLNNNTLKINKDINLNNIFGDCQKLKPKFLRIKFMLNNYNQFTMSFSEINEHLINDLNIDFSNKNYNIGPCWDLIDSPQFKNITTDIYKNLSFHSSLIHISNQFINNLHITNSCIVNIIHLRLESDAINFWSIGNNLSYEDFYNKLSEKYIYLINKLITNKSDKTIILTYSNNNRVIDYLKNNNYNYYIHDKNKNNNREENAVIDLINSKYCNNVFIAVEGSTFSWTIDKIINPRHIEWIDINNIR
jgi:hypothetical protein